MVRDLRFNLVIDKINANAAKSQLENIGKTPIPISFEAPEIQPSVNLRVAAKAISGFKPSINAELSFNTSAISQKLASLPTAKIQIDTSQVDRAIARVNELSTAIKSHLSQPINVIAGVNLETNARESAGIMGKIIGDTVAKVAGDALKNAGGGFFSNVSRGFTESIGSEIFQGSKGLKQLSRGIGATTDRIGSSVSKAGLNAISRATGFQNIEGLQKQISAFLDPNAIAQPFKDAAKIAREEAVKSAVEGADSFETFFDIFADELNKNIQTFAVKQAKGAAVRTVAGLSNLSAPIQAFRRDVNIAKAKEEAKNIDVQLTPDELTAVQNAQKEIVVGNPGFFPFAEGETGRILEPFVRRLFDREFVGLENPTQAALVRGESLPQKVIDQLSDPKALETVKSLGSAIAVFDKELGDALKTVTSGQDINDILVSQVKDDQIKGQVATSALQAALGGTNLDLAEQIAKINKIKELRPDLKVKFLGFSGGGAIGDDLTRAGSVDKSATIGTPFFQQPAIPNARGGKDFQFNLLDLDSDPLQEIQSDKIKDFADAGFEHALSNYLKSSEVRSFVNEKLDLGLTPEQIETQGIPKSAQGKPKLQGLVGGNLIITSSLDSHLEEMANFFNPETIKGLTGPNITAAAKGVINQLSTSTEKFGRGTGDENLTAAQQKIKDLVDETKLAVEAASTNPKEVAELTIELLSQLKELTKSVVQNKPLKDVDVKSSEEVKASAKRNEIASRLVQTNKLADKFESSGLTELAVLRREEANVLQEQLNALDVELAAIRENAAIAKLPTKEGQNIAKKQAEISKLLAEREEIESQLVAADRNIQRLSRQEATRPLAEAQIERKAGLESRRSEIDLAVSQGQEYIEAQKALIDTTVFSIDRAEEAAAKIKAIEAQINELEASRKALTGEKESSTKVLEKFQKQGAPKALTDERQQQIDSISEEIDEIDQAVEQALTFIEGQKAILETVNAEKLAQQNNEAIAAVEKITQLQEQRSDVIAGIKLAENKIKQFSQDGTPQDLIEVQKATLTSLKAQKAEIDKTLKKQQQFVKEQKDAVELVRQIAAGERLSAEQQFERGQATARLVDLEQAREEVIQELLAVEKRSAQLQKQNAPEIATQFIKAKEAALKEELDTIDRSIQENKAIVNGQSRVKESVVETVAATDSISNNADETAANADAISNASIGMAASIKESSEKVGTFPRLIEKVENSIESTQKAWEVFAKSVSDNALAIESKTLAAITPKEGQTVKDSIQSFGATKVSQLSDALSTIESRSLGFLDGKDGNELKSALQQYAVNKVENVISTISDAENSILEMIAPGRGGELKESVQIALSSKVSEVVQAISSVEDIALNLLAPEKGQELKEVLQLYAASKVEDISQGFSNASDIALDLLSDGKGDELKDLLQKLAKEKISQLSEGISTAESSALSAISRIDSQELKSSLQKIVSAKLSGIAESLTDVESQALSFLAPGKEEGLKEILQQYALEKISAIAESLTEAENTALRVLTPEEGETFKTSLQKIAAEKANELADSITEVERLFLNALAPGKGEDLKELLQNAAASRKESIASNAKNAQSLVVGTVSKGVTATQESLLKLSSTINQVENLMLNILAPGKGQDLKRLLQDGLLINKNLQTALNIIIKASSAIGTGVKTSTGVLQQGENIAFGIDPFGAPKIAKPIIQAIMGAVVAGMIAPEVTGAITGAAGNLGTAAGAEIGQMLNNYIASLIPNLNASILAKSVSGIPVLGPSIAQAVLESQAAISQAASTILPEIIGDVAGAAAGGVGTVVVGAEAVRTGKIIADKLPGEDKSQQLSLPFSNPVITQRIPQSRQPIDLPQSKQPLDLPEPRRVLEPVLVEVESSFSALSTEVKSTTVLFNQNRKKLGSNIESSSQEFGVLASAIKKAKTLFSEFHSVLPKGDKAKFGTVVEDFDAIKSRIGSQQESLKKKVATLRAASTPEEKGQSALEIASIARDAKKAFGTRIRNAREADVITPTEQNQLTGSLAQLGKQEKEARAVLQRLVNEFNNAGRDIGHFVNKGLAEGLNQDDAEKSAYNLVNNIIKVAEDKLEISSPSKVGIRIGRFFVQGVAQLAGQDKAIALAGNLANAIADATQDGFLGKARGVVTPFIQGINQEIAESQKSLFTKGSAEPDVNRRLKVGQVAKDTPIGENIPRDKDFSINRKETRAIQAEINDLIKLRQESQDKLNQLGLKKNPKIQELDSDLSTLAEILKQLDKEVAASTNRINSNLESLSVAMQKGSKDPRAIYQLKASTIAENKGLEESIKRDSIQLEKVKALIDEIGKQKVTVQTETQELKEARDLIDLINNEIAELKERKNELTGKIVTTKFTPQPENEIPLDPTAKVGALKGGDIAAENITKERPFTAFEGGEEAFQRTQNELLKAREEAEKFHRELLEASRTSSDLVDKADLNEASKLIDQINQKIIDLRESKLAVSGKINLVDYTEEIEGFKALEFTGTTTLKELKAQAVELGHEFENVAETIGTSEDRINFFDLNRLREREQKSQGFGENFAPNQDLSLFSAKGPKNTFDPLTDSAKKAKVATNDLAQEGNEATQVFQFFSKTVRKNLNDLIGKGNVDRLERGIRNAAKAAQEGTTPVSAFFERIDKTSRSAGRGIRFIAENLGNAIKGFIAFTVVDRAADYLRTFAGEAFEAQKQLNTFTSQLTVATGSQELAVRRLTEAKNIARDIKAPVLASADAYAKLAIATKGTAIEGDAALDFYKNFLIVSRSIGLSADDQSGAQRQLNQAIQLGRLQAEEANAINERGIALNRGLTSTLKISTAELRRQQAAGTIGALEIANAIAFLAEEAKAGGNETVLAFNQLGNAILRTQEAVAGIIGPGVTESVKILAQVIESVGSGFQRLAPIVLALLSPLNAVLGVIKTIGSALGFFSKIIDSFLGEGTSAALAITAVSTSIAAVLIPAIYAATTALLALAVTALPGLGVAFTAGVVAMAPFLGWIAAITAAALLAKPAFDGLARSMDGVTDAAIANGEKVGKTTSVMNEANKKLGNRVALTDKEFKELNDTIQQGVADGTDSQKVADKLTAHYANLQAQAIQTTTAQKKLTASIKEGADNFKKASEALEKSILTEEVLIAESLARQSISEENANKETLDIKRKGTKQQSQLLAERKDIIESQLREISRLGNLGGLTDEQQKERAEDKKKLEEELTQITTQGLQTRLEIAKSARDELIAVEKEGTDKIKEELEKRSQLFTDQEKKDRIERQRRINSGLSDSEQAAEDELRIARAKIESEISLKEEEFNRLQAFNEENPTEDSTIQKQRKDAAKKIEDELTDLALQRLQSIDAQEKQFSEASVSRSRRQSEQTGAILESEKADQEKTLKFFQQSRKLSNESVADTTLAIEEESINKRLQNQLEFVEKLEQIKPSNNLETELAAIKEIRAAQTEYVKLQAEAIDIQIQKEDRLKERIIGRLEKQIELTEKASQTQELSFRAIEASTERQSRLSNARLELINSETSLQKTQLEIQRDRSTSEVTRSQITKQIQALELSALKERQKAEIQSLEIETKRNALAAQRRATEAEIALLQAQKDKANADQELNDALVSGESERIQNAKTQVNLIEKQIDLNKQLLAISQQSITDEKAIAKAESDRVKNKQEEEKLKLEQEKRKQNESGNSRSSAEATPSTGGGIAGRVRANQERALGVIAARKAKRIRKEPSQVSALESLQKADLSQKSPRILDLVRNAPVDLKGIGLKQSQFPTTGQQVGPNAILSQSVNETNQSIAAINERILGITQKISGQTGDIAIGISRFADKSQQPKPQTPSKPPPQRNLGVTALGVI